MRKIAWLVVYVLLSACVDPISFTTPQSTFQLVVDGTITDEPGPYTVTLSLTRRLDQATSSTLPVNGAKITIHSDAGETENLVPTGEPGVYRTTTIQGVVGRSYSILITMAGGAVYESDPEILPPAGSIDAINYEFEQKLALVGGVQTTGGIFKIFSDGKAGSNGVNYVRWRTFGTYKIENFPQDRVRTENELIIPDPVPCSGYVNRGGFLTRIGECTCCYCWVSEYGTPTVTDTQLVTGGSLNHIRVGTVNVNRRTFYEKYYLEVQQMSLTQGAYNFWKLIETQREGASSLFQPPLGQVKGNIHNTSNASEVVQGYFGASGIRRKSIFLTRKDVPVFLHPIDTLTNSCIGLNSTNIQPPFWK